MIEGKGVVGIVEHPIAPRYTRRDMIVIQLLGLAALMVVTYSVMSYELRILKYMFLIFPAVFAVVKPNIIPYLLIANFFVQPAIFSPSVMMRVLVIDVTIMLFILAFISHKRNAFNAAVEKQRLLLTILCIFLLWAAVGYICNFAGRSNQTNITSAFFIFNIFQLIAAVIIFSHPDWKPHREKVIAFYIVCTFLEIIAAVAIEVLGGARSLDDFYKLCGTLGGHHGMLANILVLGAGVSAAAFFQMRGRRHIRRFSIIVCFSCIVLLLISGSRSSLLGMFLAVPVITLLNYSYKPIVRFVLLLLIPVAIVAVLRTPLMDLLVEQVVLQDMSNPDFSTYGRLLIWERVYEHALYGPWLQKIVGIGIGTFDTLTFRYTLFGDATNASGAHNNILHAFVETGIVGMVIFISFFVEIVRRLLIRSRSNDNAARCFLMCTLTFLFSGLTQETIWFQPVYGRFWLQYLFCYLILFNFGDESFKGMKGTLQQI